MVIGKNRPGYVLSAVILSVLPFAGEAGADARDHGTQVEVTLAAGAESPAEILTGRILLTAADGGIILEERNGTIRNLSPPEFQEIFDTRKPFALFDSDELAEDLVNRLGGVFRIRQKQHFVICSAASDIFTDYYGELLERVYQEFFAFFAADDAPNVSRPDYPLPVVIFRNVSQLQQHAAGQHPQIPFDEVPGYYSSRFNQIYISDIPGRVRTRGGLIRLLRKSPRHTETIVHEAVHQIAFNSGLHVRFADNPLWFTEGVAIYFESFAGGRRLLWNGPGRPHTNYLSRLRGSGHLPRLTLSLADLISDNALFEDAGTMAAAYANSWAVVYTLVQTDHAAFRRIARTLQQRQVLRQISRDDELKEIASALGRSLSDIESDVNALLKSLPRRRR